MWNAFTSDLLDFVSTITEDTSKTINKVIGEDDTYDEEDEQTIREKLICDLRRSFMTYGTAMEEHHAKEFERYLKSKFSLSTYATEISEILDVEPDVSRYYAELVPITITPEEFWARYFFRMILVNRNGAVNLDEDDEEEEIMWESTEKEDQVAAESAGASNSDHSDSTALINENQKLKEQVKLLVKKVSELERLVQEKDRIITDQLNSNTAIVTGFAIEKKTELTEQVQEEVTIHRSSTQDNHSLHPQAEPSVPMPASDESSCVLVSEDEFSSNSSLTSDLPMNADFIHKKGTGSDPANKSRGQVEVPQQLGGKKVIAVSLEDDEEDGWA